MIWLLRLSYALVWGGVFLAMPFSRKIRSSFRERKGLLKRWKTAADTWDPLRKRLWFHVSSAGELEQVYPLLDRIKQKHPETYLALSFFSPSAHQALQKELQRRFSFNLPCSWDYADYSPWDFPKQMRAFLETLKPHACFLIHQELWPELLFQNHQFKIPTFLLAAHFSQKNLRSPLQRFLLPLLKGIVTVDEQSLSCLKEIEWEGFAMALGDPRWERVLERKAQFSKNIPWKVFFEKRPVFVGASLWDEDFKALEKPLSALLTQNPHLCLLLVPHEPTPRRVRSWQKKLKALGIPTRKWSHWIKSPDMHSHLIVDEVGFLAELYQTSTWVFVGGSFKKKIHNVLEPLAHGALLFSGPFISNSSEAQELFRLGLLRVASHEKELTSLLTTQILKNSEKETLHSKGQAFLESRKGVSEQYLQMLTSWMGLQ